MVRNSDTDAGLAGPAPSARSRRGRRPCRSSSPSAVRLADPHRLADLDHGPLRDPARLRRAELDEVVEVLRPGEERLALLAHPLLVRSELLEQLPLAIDAADARGPAVLVHPRDRLRRRVDLVQVVDAADVR